MDFLPFWSVEHGTGLGRAPIALATCAGLVVVSLFTARGCSVEAGGNVLRVVPQVEAPPWKPGVHWATAPAPVPREGGPLAIPIYPAWTKKQAEELFAIGPYEMFDPLCGKLWKPNLSLPQNFPEYEGGRIVFATNSLSMREDGEVRSKQPLLRILVTGDSHTDGVCNNRESFANLAEAELRRRAGDEAAERRERFDPESIDVLNAGKGTFSFFNYLGLLERRLDLRPDVFVVTVYGGNDFEEVLWPWHDYGNDGPRPAGSAPYADRIEAARQINGRPLSQALVSVKLFSAYPAEQDVAVRAGAAVMEQIRDLCRERGIRLIVLYLPSWPDIEPTLPSLKLRKLLEALELTPEALAVTDRLADRWLAKQKELGIETIDLRPAFKASKTSAYWTADWHINLVGHRIVADELIKALCQRR